MGVIVSIIVELLLGLLESRDVAYPVLGLRVGLPAIGVLVPCLPELQLPKGPPSLAITEHWNYTDTGKDFPGGYACMSQGPLPIDWAHTLTGGRGLWGMELRNEMAKYIHQAGLKIVGEVLPERIIASS